jgi:peptide/nickel transport system substrate-binding protein
MTSQFFRQTAAAAALMVILGAMTAQAEPQHGIAMYGTPALPPDFVSLPYANPDAPKGGRITFGESGTFDSLNPFVPKGSAAAGISALTVETLMGRSYDEPFSLYGLLAESIEVDEARTYAQFTLREGARFSDGNPVTVEDVIWSMETLGTVGHPRYQGAWAKVAKSEKIDDRTVKFTFAEVDRELPLILGLRPILERAQWEGRDFAETANEAIIGSGPYMVGPHDMGAQITYVRNPNWWGADLPFYKGTQNFSVMAVWCLRHSRAARSPAFVKPTRQNGPAFTTFPPWRLAMSSNRKSPMRGHRASRGSRSTHASRCLPTGVCARR